MMMTQLLEHGRKMAFTAIFLVFTPLAANAAGTTLGSESVPLPTTTPGQSYFLASANGVFANTYYYGFWNQNVGTINEKCAIGFTPQLSASIYGTPDSDSISGGCQLYGINNSVWLNPTITGYQVLVNVHLRYPSDCADKGAYISWVVTCAHP